MTEEHKVEEHKHAEHTEHAEHKHAGHAEHVEHKEHEKHEEHKVEHKTEEHHEHKEKFNFQKWIKGSNKSEYVENISFVIILVSAVMFSLGILLGSFISGITIISVLGSFLVMIGIIVYMISQFIVVKNG